MDPPAQGDEQARPSPTEVDAVLAATRALVAISAQSVAKIETLVTRPKLRVLAIIASRGPQNLNFIAHALGVDLFTATRTCNKLVEAGLLHRSNDPTDRRELVLQLTESGRQLIQTMHEHRRAAVATILAKIGIEQRHSLVPHLLTFADAAGEVPDSSAWTFGWTTQPPPDTHDHNSTDFQSA